MKRRDFIQVLGIMPVAAALPRDKPNSDLERDFFLIRKAPNNKRELHELDGWIVGIDDLCEGDMFLIFDYNDLGYAYVHNYHVRDKMKMAGWVSGKRSASCTIHYLNNCLIVTKINGIPHLADDICGMCEQD